MSVNEKSYTVSEIDRLRKAIILRNELPHPNPYGPKDVRAWRAGIEDRLRTYMTNGTRPEEIEALVEKIPRDERGWQWL